jgi:hypothetical protein
LVVSVIIFTKCECQICFFLTANARRHYQPYDERQGGSFNSFRRVSWKMGLKGVGLAPFATPKSNDSLKLKSYIFFQRIDSNRTKPHTILFFSPVLFLLKTNLNRTVNTLASDNLINILHSFWLYLSLKYNASKITYL